MRQVKAGLGWVSIAMMRAFLLRRRRARDCDGDAQQTYLSVSTSSSQVPAQHSPPQYPCTDAGPAIVRGAQMHTSAKVFLLTQTALQIGHMPHGD